MKNSTNSPPKNQRARTFVLIIGIVIVLAAMAYWGGTTRPGPLFWTGVLLLAATLPALGALIWWLLYSPMPVELPAARTGLPAAGRQLIAIAMTISSLLFLVGGLWDESWHRHYGLETVLDDFFWRPHQLIYISLGLTAAFGFAGLLVVLRRPGSIRHRFRSEPTLALLAIVALYLTIAAPIDALWHEIYGLDLSGWSLPHIVMLVGVTLVMMSAVLLQISLVHRRPWRGLRRMKPGEWLAVLLLSTTAVIFMLVVLTDWENARLPDTHSGFVSAFWSRPDWLLPVVILATAAFFGTTAQRALRRAGAATLVGLLVFGIRGLVSLIFSLTDPGLEMNFVSQVAILPPLIALDLWMAFARQKDSEAARNGAVAAAVAAGLAITIPLLPAFLSYFQPDLPMFLGALVFGLPVALWFGWVGSLLGDGMYGTDRLTVDGKELIRPRVVWAGIAALLACTVLAVYFILTASPPV